MFNVKLSLDKFLFALRESLGKPRCAARTVRFLWLITRLPMLPLVLTYNNDLNLRVLESDSLSEPDIIVGNFSAKTVRFAF